MPNTSESMMERHVYWQPWDGLGLEHLHFLQNAQDVLADGMILRMEDNIPFRVHYRIHCDLQWRVREIETHLLDGINQAIVLRSDGVGHWVDATGAPVSTLEGCREVDISATPFTNTLSIRRLQLEPGESAEISVTYVVIPEMQIKPVRQRYTCLETNIDGGKYKYEESSSQFTANLLVDANGFVMDYPRLFKRVWPR